MSDRSPSASIVTSDVPRNVRRKTCASVGCGRVFILPHIAVGVWLASKALMLVLCWALGSAVPGRVVGGWAEPHKASTTYTIDVAYAHDGIEHHALREVKHYDYERLMAAPGAGRAQPAPAVQVHAVGLGPWHYARVALSHEDWFFEVASIVFAAFLWNAFMSIPLYLLYLEPARARRLYRFGVVAPGRITSSEKVSGRGAHYKVGYAFRPDGGHRVVRATMKVNVFEGPRVVVGDPVRVLHYPGRERPSVVYEFGDYRAQGMPARVDATTFPRIDPDPAATQQYRIRPNSLLLDGLLLPALRSLGALLLVAGIVGFFGGLLATTGALRFFGPATELPLGDVESIAADSAGRVYIYSSFYSRIQLYDANGNFLRGWFASPGKSPVLHFDGQDQLQLVSDHGDRVVTYDRDGTVAATEYNRRDLYEDLQDEFQRGVRGADGSTYRVSGRFFYPRVVRTAPDGTTRIVVAPPTYLTVLTGPMPAWGIGILGGLILGTSGKWAKSRQGGDAVGATPRQSAAR